MSLRTRLTLLNIALLGGILLLFGAAVFSLVTIILLEQVDNDLAEAAREVVLVTRVNSQGDLVVEIPNSVDMRANVFIQVWSRNGALKTASLNIQEYQRPLDPLGLQTSSSNFRDATVEGIHIRVLTVPLQFGDRPIGTVQVGTSLEVVDEVQQELLIVIVLASLALMSVAGLAGWLATQTVLAPLKVVTESAMEITRTNDLSRRVPLREPLDLEIRQLIEAFNQTLTRLERMINTQRRFLADVGHELRTPLTVIKGNVDLIRKLGGMDEESLAEIEDEADRLTRLVGDLLLLAQAESGKLPLDRQIVELDTVLLEVFRQAKLLAGDRLNVRIGEIDQVLVNGDRDRLKQVVLNLTVNAVKYTVKDGLVELSLGKQNGEARLAIRDTGPGIPDEDLPHIFERFYRGEKSRSRSQDGKGFGLGLSIAYWIVRNHEGRIEVKSREGQGTVFQVYLPLAEA